MPPFKGIGDRVLARNEARRDAFGVSFLYEDHATYTAIEKILAQADFPFLEIEGAENIHELDPRILDCLPLDCPLREGGLLTYPADGDPVKNRYKVASIQEERVQGTLVRKFALIFLATKRSPKRT